MSGEAVRTLQSVLGRLASDHRRAVAYYGNAAARPGSANALRRVLSDVGFPTASQFTYLAPAAAHITRHEDARNVARVSLFPYGIVEDYARFRSTDETARRVRTDHTTGSTGLRLNPANPDYLVSSELDDDTYAEGKTARIVQAITSSRLGPAYHVVISRRGDVIVSAALDDETRASRDNSATSVDVALEGALTLSSSDHAAQRYSVIEMPFTVPQVAALTSLLGKLFAAYPAIARELVTAGTSNSGVAYNWPSELSAVAQQNFSRSAWRTHSVFNHEDSDAPRLFQLIADLPPFDLATTVFRTSSAPVRTGRVEAQTAVSQADTAGATSVMLGAYTALAGNERAAEMQGTPRLQVFVQRINVAHQDAADTGLAASQVAEAASPAAPAPATNVGPHVFDFVTGLWGDGRAY